MSGDLQGESITRNTAFALAVQLTGALFTALITLFLVRALGPQEFGLLALALAVGLIFVPLSDFGISYSSARFIAEHLRDRAAVAEVLRNAIRLKLLAASAICAPLFAASGLIADAYDIPELTWPLRAVSLAVFAQSLMLFFLTTFEALGRIRMSLRVVLTESSTEAGTTIALVLLGAGATGAAFGRVAGYAIAVLLGTMLLARVVRPSVDGRYDGGVDWRRIARYAAALLVIDGAMTVFNRIDALLIGGFLSASSVGLFEAPMRLAAFLHYGGLAVASGVSPRLAAGEDGERSVEPFKRGLRYVVLLQALFMAPLVVWANPIVDVALGSEYGESADVVRALAPFVFLSGLAPMVAIGLNYLGEARRRVPLAIAAVLVNVVIDVVLIPEIGIVAGAVGSGAAYALYVPVQLWLCRNALGFSLLPLFTTLCRALLAALVMAGVLLAIGTDALSAPDWVLGASGGSLAYVGVLIVSGELKRSELRVLFGLPRRLRMWLRRP